MRSWLLLPSAILAALIAACGPAVATGHDPALTPGARARLVALRAEAKFGPELFRGYVGVDLEEDREPLTASVNTLIDAILALPDGPVSQTQVLPLISEAIQEVDLFATEDRERAYRYFDQVWKLLGLTGDPVRLAA
jgi:hypothetical protein